MLFLVDGRFFDTFYACTSCRHCLYLARCIEESLVSVLPEKDCIGVLYGQGSCSFDCKGCFYPKEEPDE